VGPTNKVEATGSVQPNVGTRECALLRPRSVGYFRFLRGEEPAGLGRKNRRNKV